MKILELFKKHNIDELKIKELLGYSAKFSCDELFQLELEKQNMYHSLKTKKYFNKFAVAEWFVIFHILGIEKIKKSQKYNLAKNILDQEIAEKNIKNEIVAVKLINRKKTFLHIVDNLFFEIQEYRNQNCSWDSIIKIIKKRHRTMVKDFKISKSLLINYYNQLLVDYEKRENIENILLPAETTKSFKKNK